jgi:hypothetical protein
MEKPLDSPGARDQTVDRLLRQTLETSPQGGVTDACLDAETLAAWADGGLTGGAREAVHLHVADCARCQDVAGTLARFRSAVPPAEPDPASRRWLAWFVPITAAAAAVALWFAVPGNVHRSATETELGRTGQVAQSPIAPPPPSALTPQTTRTETDRSQTLERKQLPAETAPSTPQLRAREEGARADTLNEAPVAATAQAEARVASPPAKDRIGIATERDAAGRLQAKGPEPPAEPAAAAAAPPASAAPAAAPAPERFSAARSAARPASVTPDILSPDPAVRWRILGSALQHSSNGGSTWESVPLGFPVDLTAGAAPAANVCWLVGRNGVVLLTIDGRTWRRVAFPEITDLSAIRTVDAGGRVASVSTADGRTFVTTDAGATWSAR